MRPGAFRPGERMSVVLAAAAVPLLSGMVYVFVVEAGGFLLRSYAPRPLLRAGWSAASVRDAAMWGSPLLNACLTAVVANRIYARTRWVRPAVWVFALTSAISTVVLCLVFAFPFSLSFRRWDPGLWYSLSIPLAFGAGLMGGALGRRHRERREDLSRILDGPGEGREGVRRALADYTRFTSVPAVHAMLGGSGFFASSARLERHRPALEAAGGMIAGLSRGVASGAPSAVGVRRLPPDIRHLLAPLGIRSVVTLPLGRPSSATPDSAVLYFTRPAFLVGSHWQFGLLASQLALRLENAELLDAARRMAVLEERQRLAREIHDTVAQDLIGIVVNLEAVERSGLGASEDRLEPIREAVRTARRSLQETRRLVWALRPMVLEQNPLPAALSRYLREWSSQSGVEAAFVQDGEPYRLRPDAEITFFRMLQESCSNVARHARARRVWGRLTFAPDEVVLSVRDDGVGMQDGGAGVAGVGLTAMRERIESLGGMLAVRSASGEGTELRAVIPRGALAVPEERHGTHSGPGRG